VRNNYWLTRWIKIKFLDKKGQKCPICSYRFKQCQCLFGGSCHPDRSKRREVVLHHLYLFSKRQIKHIVKLERYWHISYGDSERADILAEIERTVNN